jgi:hypothetical protein
MKTTTLLSALALLATALAIVPSSQAMTMPPPCESVTGTCCGIQPADMYCCSVLSCPPPVARCPTERVGIDEVLALTGTYWVYSGPHVEVMTNSACTATVCESATSCWAPACSDGTATCCSAGPVMSATPCDCAPSPLPPPVATSAAIALPLPHATASLESDCSVTVGDTWACPNGFDQGTINYDAGPVQVHGDECVPQCRCMPIEGALVLPRLDQVLG